MGTIQADEPEIYICPQRRKFIASNAPCIVLGGPGSGKTTIALIKANSDIADGNILPYQKILFLSFARATVARVIEKAHAHVNKANQKFLEINTYHGYAWLILESHGYLLGLSRKIKLFTPANAASHLADIRSQKIKKEEKERLEREEIVRLAFNAHLLSFDLFAELTHELLQKNPELTKIICSRYPIIILDEFQDCDVEEWKLIKELGKYSRLIALADPNQRIYEFRGADPARIRHFVEAFNPERYDFGIENNRSPGTDIIDYGNDILDGSNKRKTYSNVLVVKWGFLYRSQTYTLKSKVLEACRRLNNVGNNWSLAVLVPTKQLMLTVSQAFSKNENGMPRLYHSVSIDAEGPTLAAVAIAFLLEPLGDHRFVFAEFINCMCTFYRGRGASNPSVADINQSKSLQNALEKAAQKGLIPNSSVIKKSDELLRNLRSIKFTGEPEKDWILIREMLANSQCVRLQDIAEQATYVRLLGKGSQLRELLANSWRRNGCYLNARQIFEEAFKQEHFIASTSLMKGVIVMNMHKAKGKEFDEVILYEDQFQGRYLSKYGNPDQARLNFRVSVTRARQRTTILTPTREPSVLLF